MYSVAVRRLLMHPENGDKDAFYNCVGVFEAAIPCRTNPRKILLNKVRFLVYIYEGVIMNTRWEIFGDPIAYAVGSWVVQHTKRVAISDLPNIMIPQRIAMELDIKSEHDIRAGCMSVINAMVAAIEDYKSREDTTI